jgi:hypothetical protein
MSRWSWILLLLSSVFLASCTTHRVTHYARETPDEFPVLRSVGYGIVDVQPGPTRSEKILQAIRASRLDADNTVTDRAQHRKFIRRFTGIMRHPMCGATG